MIRSGFVATRSFRFAISGVGLVMLLATMAGVFGTTAKFIVALCTTFVLVLICIELCIRTSVSLLNRACRYARQTSSVSHDDDAADCGMDPIATGLRATLDAMREDEETWARCYEARRCSLDDLVRAKSLRVQAEIALLRHEAMPQLPVPANPGRYRTEWKSHI